jgi:hypothetical protein
MAAAQLPVPHPLVAHGADAARRLARIGDAAQHRGHHVAMLQRRDHLRALAGIVPQPVQQLRESPLGRVHAAAPFERFQFPGAPGRGDLGGFALGAMVAPQIVIVQRRSPSPTGMTLDPVVSSARLRVASPSTPAASSARRMAVTSACMWSRCDCVAWSGSSFLRVSGYSPVAEPSRPLCTLSKIDTRTLSVPKVEGIVGTPADDHT